MGIEPIKTGLKYWSSTNEQNLLLSKIAVYAFMGADARVELAPQAL